MLDGEVELRDQKAALRAAMLAVREAVTGEVRAHFESCVAGSLKAALDNGDATAKLARIALYAAKESEARVEALSALATEFVAYPVVEGSEIAFRRVNSARELSLGTFGLLEPSSDAEKVLPGRLTLIVVPGLAFDRAGGRLGWGRGYYDRALARHPTALRVGVAFSAQIVDRVPTGDSDVAMNILLTEQGAIVCRPFI